MPQRPKPEVRQRFLAAAAELFERHGFRDTSLRAVAARAGGTLGNLRAYFPTKDGLFEAVCGDVAREVEQAIAAARGLPIPRPSADHVSTDARLVQLVLDYIVEHRDVLYLLLERSEGSARSGWRDELLSAYTTLEEARLRAFVQAHGDRLIRVPSPRLVRALCLMYFALAEDFVRSDLTEEDFRMTVREFDAFRHAGTTHVLGLSE